MPRSRFDYSFIIYYRTCCLRTCYLTIRHVDGLLLVCFTLRTCYLVVEPLSLCCMLRVCLCDVMCMKASMGISFLSLLNKPQMPPRRANPNPNNNNNNITPEM